MAVAPSEEEKGEATQRSDAASRLAARRAAKAAAKAAKRGTSPLVPGSVTKKVEAARSFYQDNARLLLGGAGAGLIAAVLWITFSSQSRKQEREATDQLYAGIEAMNAPVIGPDETPPKTSRSTPIRARGHGPRRRAPSFSARPRVSRTHRQPSGQRSAKPTRCSSSASTPTPRRPTSG